MTDATEDTFVSIETSSEARPVRPASSAAALSTAASACAQSQEEFARDLWLRLLERNPLEPCSIIQGEISASPSRISEDFEDASLSLWRGLGESETPSAKSKWPRGHSPLASHGVFPERRAERTLVLEESVAEEFRQFTALLRRHGFGEVQHTLNAGSLTVSVDPRSLWTLCTEVLRAYEQRGRRLQQALLAERSEDRQKRDGRVQELLRKNAKLQEELSAVRRTEAEGQSLTAASRNAQANAANAANAFARDGSSFRIQKAEALARQREQELEKLKSRLEQALAALAQRKESQPTKKAAKDSAKDSEALSLRKQVQSLSFRLEEAEVKLRQAEAVQSRRAALEHTEGGAKWVEALEALEAERRMRCQLEEDLKESHMRHSAEVKTLSKSLREAEERAERCEAAVRMREASDSQCQRDACRLREDLAEARRAWKAVDTRSLIRRDKELRQLGLDAHALEESVAKADLVDMFLELCRLVKTNDMSGLVSEVKSLTARSDSTPEMLQLAQGSLEALKELYGRVLSPAEVLREVKEMCAAQSAQCARGTLQQVHQETQVEELRLSSRGASEASVDAESQKALLDELASIMFCSRDQLLSRVQALASAEQRSVGSERNACRLREDLAEARRAWKAVDTRSLIRRDKELRQLGLDAHALEESVAKADLVDMFLELCRLVKTNDMSGLVSEVKKLATSTRRQTTEMSQVHRETQANLEPSRFEELSRELAKCQEHLAAHHIVTALQKLLCVGNISEVLPALKEVLDVTALRKKMERAVDSDKGVLAAGGA